MRKHRLSVFAALVCLLLGKLVVLSGCGSSTQPSGELPSAKEFADGARQIEENNKRHVREALAARAKK